MKSAIKYKLETLHLQPKWAYIVENLLFYKWSETIYIYIICGELEFIILN